MEIIKKGKTTEKWSINVTCTGNGNDCTSGCHAELRVNRDDLRFYDGNSGYFQRDDAVLFKCPCCNGITDMARQDWPTKPHDLVKFSTAWRNEHVSN